MAKKDSKSAKRKDRPSFYGRLISGGKVLLDEAEKAHRKGDAERRAFMLNDCVEFLSNGLKKRGEFEKR